MPTAAAASPAAGEKGGAAHTEVLGFDARAPVLARFAPALNTHTHDTSLCVLAFTTVSEYSFKPDPDPAF